jgi:competence protein ComEC
LHAAGVNRVDGVLLSHGDSLHIGAADLLMRDFVPRRLIHNSMPDRSTVHRRLRQVLLNRRINVINLNAGESFTIGSAVSGKVLFPPRGFSAAMADDQALVLQLSGASAKILFMSDSGYATEKWLLASAADLRSEILIKGQHYSGNSGSDAFLNAVQSRLIIATSRDFPEHERISDEWVERVRSRGIKVFRQDETGAVQVDLSQRNWEARAYVTGEIFRSAN